MRNASSSRRWLSLLSLSISIFLVRTAAAAGDAAPPPAANALTLLIVQTDPPGAEISVDGVAAGRSPAALDKVTPGPHHLSATLEDHAPAAQDIEVKAGETNIEKMKLALLQGTLQLSTTETIQCALGTLRLTIAAGDVPLVKVPAGPLSIHCEADGMLPINQSVRIAGDQIAQIALKPTRMVTSDKFRVESPDKRTWELRGGNGAKLCVLPCTLTWPGRGMTVQLSTDLTSADREVKTLPDEIPFLPEPGTTVDSIWMPGRGNLARSIIGMSVSAALIGGAVPLCIITLGSESGTNVAAGVGCVAGAALGAVMGTLFTISLVTYAPGRWNFTAALDPDQKTEDGLPKKDPPWRFAFNGTSAKLDF